MRYTTFNVFPKLYLIFSKLSLVNTANPSLLLAAFKSNSSLRIEVFPSTSWFPILFYFNKYSVFVPLAYFIHSLPFNVIKVYRINTTPPTYITSMEWKMVIILEFLQLFYHFFIFVSIPKHAFESKPQQSLQSSHTLHLWSTLESPRMLDLVFFERINASRIWIHRTTMVTYNFSNMPDT